MNDESLGSRIKAIRKSLQMTQEEFVRPLEISRGHLCSIEIGYDNASASLLKLISLMYPVSLEWMTTGAGAMMQTACIPNVRADQRGNSLTSEQIEAIDDANMAHLTALDAENAFYNAVQLTDEQHALFRACITQAREAQDELQRAIRKGVNP